MAMLPFETLFNFYRGIKGLSIDIRKCPDKVKETCDALGWDKPEAYSHNTGWNRYDLYAHTFD